MGTIADHIVDLGALNKAQTELKLTDPEIAATIGVDKTTLWRWRKELTTPRGIVRSRLSQIEELRHLLRQVFDGPDLARTWLREAHPQALGGTTTPLDAMRAGRIDRVLTVLEFLARGA